MRIVVGSQSQVKLDAVKKACENLGIEAEITGVKAQSGINEQPMELETLRGAARRAEHAVELDPKADIYIAIENGLFQRENDDFEDCAVVLALHNGKEDFILSEGVVFPRQYVEEACAIGFDTMTVGKVMASHGVVAKHDDPHLTLAGISRVDFLIDALEQLFTEKLGMGSAKPPADKPTDSRILKPTP